MDGFHGEAAAGWRLGARQEVERVLHVKGSDGDVDGRREENTRRCGKRTEEDLLSLSAFVL